MAQKIWQLQLEGQESQVYPIDKSPTILGRSSDCDIVINESSVSSHHIQFTLDGKALAINDLNSKNGTAVDGKTVNQVRIKPLLSSKYKLRVGKVHLKLVYGAPINTNGSEKQPQIEVEVAEWHFISDQREYGPLTIQQVFAAVDQGLLRPTDEFWKAGSADRCKAFEVAGLFDGTINPESKPLEVDAGSTVQCPYCWHRFGVHEVLFVSSHPELLGDDVLGDDEPQRFLPSRFTAEGLALDAKGLVCPDMACPNCHMRLPAAYLDHRPLIMSVVGAPGSGKSYFLASASWCLRTCLPKVFGVRFMDIDAITNRWLNEYEEKLFFQPDGAGYQAIAKTDLTAPTLYRQVSLKGMSVFLPLPSLFVMDFNAGGNDALARRSLVLYDNAGEHFQAGADSASAPGTKHLIHAEGIVFLFDPTEDPRFRSVLKREDGTGPNSMRVHRQDVLLVEMVARIRKYLGLASGEKLKKTIVLGVSKADLLRHLLPIEKSPWIESTGSGALLDMGIIEEMSQKVRQIMDQYAPEIVATVETFAENVIYVPNSALGHNPSEQGVKPSEIAPRWVEVPFLYILAKRGHLPHSGIRELNGELTE